jgi:glycogen phosphorylase
MPGFLPRDLPEPITILGELALDLRWTWTREADALWRRIDEELWTRTRNPWVILQSMSDESLCALAIDRSFTSELDRLARARTSHLEHPGWFASKCGSAKLTGVAYFSMEFGLGEALPLYAGGLGILAGDYLKTASDLGLPVIGIGLLYQEGYFRQIIDGTGWQQEAYPFNDPGSMPIRPALGPNGAWLHVTLELPGRAVRLRVWQATVGRVPLYLLDANGPSNAPTDRGITAKLYEAGSEIRLLQEIVLGIAGWRVVEAVAPDTEICHLNEGHAAFVVFERARSHMRRFGLSFWEAVWATRAGNVFTTHTPVAAGFDQFPAELIAAHSDQLAGLVDAAGITMDEFLALGRSAAADHTEPFNMAYLAMRGSLLTIGVSRLHGNVSRLIFQPLFPRWPEREVPVSHVTNGVHVPTWASACASQLWAEASEKANGHGVSDALTGLIWALSDEQLWTMRGEGRHALVRAVRARLVSRLSMRGQTREVVAQAEQVLDPNILTLGFARRFTSYKRPILLLRDSNRLLSLLNNPTRPVQLVLTGKAHPADEDGKRAVRDWIQLAQRPEFRNRIVFLEDYDIGLGQELVQGVDVWINTPRRPWEACGTSGMKVLLNGGLNLSERDGWWEEAYAPEVGWAIGDFIDRPAQEQDARDADELYTLLEREVIPEFYTRDEAGLPRRWLRRVRQSMATLTPIYSGDRMARDYVEQLYLPAAAEFCRRNAAGGEAARAMRRWEERLRRYWRRLHVGDPIVAAEDDAWRFSVPVYLGELTAEEVRVEAFDDRRLARREGPYVPQEEAHAIVEFSRGDAIPGAVNGYIYSGTAPACRPAEYYTIRLTPSFPGVRIPTELPLILWQK